MQDYMIAMGCIIETDDEALLTERLPLMLETLRRGLIAEHGMSSDQFVGVYVLRLTPEQAKEIMAAPNKGMDAVKSMLSDVMGSKPE